MAGKRENYSEAENIALVVQVGSVCPRCGIGLFYKKGKRTFKRYQLAHIYPLSPKAEEIELLRDEERLHEDVNHPDNLIPLCGNCHGEFDKPRTAEEYRALCQLKRSLIRAEQQASLRVSYALETQVAEIVRKLATSDPCEIEGDLSYNPVSLSQKLGGEISPPLRQKIHHNVADYYQLVRREFRNLEGQVPDISSVILSQVRSFYLKQRSLGFGKEIIFSHVVDWISTKTKPQTIESAEILASFFVQNCEVFE
jgi:hypothetical protein